MTGERTPLAVRGINGDYPTTQLPGRIIESQPGEAERRAAAQVEKLRSQQEATGGDNGGS